MSRSVMTCNDAVQIVYLDITEECLDDCNPRENQRDEKKESKMSTKSELFTLLMLRDR